MVDSSFSLSPLSNHDQRRLRLAGDAGDGGAKDPPMGLALVKSQDQPFQGDFRPQNYQRRDILFPACGVGSIKCIRWPRVQCMRIRNVLLECPGRIRGHCAWKI